MSRDYVCQPGDHIPCPNCGAPGGPNGRTRARGVMTDRQYKDRRCNACGHLWTVGGTLDLPLGEPERPATPAKGESSTKPLDYDFGDEWEPKPGEEQIPF